MLNLQNIPEFWIQEEQEEILYVIYIHTASKRLHVRTNL